MDHLNISSQVGFLVGCDSKVLGLVLVIGFREIRILGIEDEGLYLQGAQGCWLVGFSM